METPDHSSHPHHPRHFMTPMVRIAIVGTLCILSLYLLVLTLSGVENFGTSANPPTNTITVTGEGTATAIPDTATISFGETATGADVATAETNVTNTINAALKGVKAAGVPDSDITTTSYGVSPHYDSPSCPPGILCPNVSSTQSGYDVSETVQVKITDTSKVATILGDLAAANVSDVTGPDYVVGDPTAVQAQARGEAIQKARADAQVLASQLGVTLGKVTSFTDNSGGSTNPEPMFAANSAAVATVAPTPSVPVGNNTYTDDVSITYEIR